MRPRMTVIVFAVVIVLIMYILVISHPPHRDPCSFPPFNVLLKERIIHQQWRDEKIPVMFEKWRSKFFSIFPNHRYILWTDETQRDLIQTKFPWFLDTYDGYEFGIQRADASRYFILYEYGGLYADLDYEPLIDFWAWLPPNVPALVEVCFG